MNKVINESLRLLQQGSLEAYEVEVIIEEQFKQRLEAVSVEPIVLRHGRGLKEASDSEAESSDTEKMSGNLHDISKIDDEILTNGYDFFIDDESFLWALTAGDQHWEKTSIKVEVVANGASKG